VRDEGGLGKINTEGFRREGDSYGYDAYGNDAYGDSDVNLEVESTLGLGKST